jgi:PAS domain S-box-containing protein
MIDESIYRLLVEQTRDYALFVLDPDGKIVTWNAGAQRLKGYKPEEIIGRHFSVFYTPQALERDWPFYELKMAAIEGRFEDEGWRVRKDGTTFWASVVITALRDDSGKLVGFSKITRDLTERKAHEEALRQSEERFRILVEGVVDYAIFMLDENGTITSWNAGAERIQGYLREEIIGKHFSHFYDAADVRAGKPWEELATAKRTGRAVDEGWRIRKNGERFWARVVVTALRDATGKMIGFAKVTQDLTERRHLHEMEEASKNLTRFIAVLAHELKNPLAPIRSAVHFMNRMPADDPAQRQMREIVERQSTHLARIVDDLVDISRITHGLLKTERDRLDLAEVVQQALEAAAPTVESSRHHLTVDVADHPVVLGDRVRLTQIVTNLLSNAMRYTPAGGNIHVSVGSEDANAVLRVRDDGMGVEGGMIDSIFDMFMRTGASEQRAAGGLGIGLALSRRLAELHGGTLEAKSEGENKGSEFILRIPLADATRAPAPSKGDTEPARTEANPVAS